MPTTDELLTLHLRFGPEAVPLRTRAFAQIVTKVLYLQPDGSSPAVSNLARDLASVLGVRQVSENHVQEALAFAAEHGVVEARDGGCALTTGGRAQIERALTNSQARIHDVLLSHFPASIDSARLKSWFHRCCAEYFARFGNRWVATICRSAAPGPASPEAVEAAIRDTARIEGLEAHTSELLAGFRGFLTSSERRDQETVFALCQAMFAARLVAAGVGADPIVTSDIRDSLIFLDTNVLLTGALEEHRLARPLATLGGALDSIGAQIRFLHLTREEYESAVAWRRECTLRAADRFAPQVVQSAADAFIKAAVARGCVSREDFERFFDQVSDITRSLSGLFRLSELDDREIAELAERGAADAVLKGEISQVWQAAGRRRPKGDRLLSHDAALVSVVEALRRDGRRSWVLTLDRTMHELALRRAGRYGLPTWISVDALLEILAVDSAGPEIQAEAFVPILLSMLDFEVEPATDTYTIEDLAWLLDIEERSADLEPEKVKSIAVMIARERLSGKSRNDPDLQLAIRRAFQAERMAAMQDAADARREAQETRRAMAAVESDRKQMEDAYVRVRVREIKREALGQLLSALLLHLVVAAVVVFVSLQIATWAAKYGAAADLVTRLLGFLVPGGGVLYRVFDVLLPTYRHKVRDAESTARREARTPRS